jgi:hypothetical protein
MSEALDLYVLDTSAWLTLIEDGAGAERIEELLEQATAGEIVVLVSLRPRPSAAPRWPRMAPSPQARPRHR